MSWLSPGTWLLYGGFALAVIAGLWRLDASIEQRGFDRAEAIHIADAQVMLQRARDRDQLLQVNNEKVRNDYLKTKAEVARAHAATAIATGMLDAEVARGRALAENAATGPGADADPRLDIIAECAGQVRELDKTARDLAGQVGALQNYTRSVCLAP